jgi:GDP/UDP-N,N'-diacetylbacillosamine 2-epimerase (hydrolysing)
VRRIGVATFARSEYSNCLPILRAIAKEPSLRLHLIVGGQHLSPEFGLTVKEIESDGFEIAEKIPSLLSADGDEAIATSIGLGTIGFSQSLARARPDILLLLGDRTELLSAASAALILRIPIAHAFGGDVTEGAIDNQVRHAISKLSHMHFVAMQSHANRLMQMGEEPWRITVTGDPALDLIKQLTLLTRKELSADLGMDLQGPVFLITYHPTTLGTDSTSHEMDCLLSGLSKFAGTMIITYPNADANGRMIIERFRSFVHSHSSASLFFNLGQRKYYSLLAIADVMVGNSSSGLWEAPCFSLPVVNIGDRQRGRQRVRNVLDVPCDATAIQVGIQKALDPSFRASLKGLRSLYGDGNSAHRIVNALAEVELGPRLLQKAFVDQSEEALR